MHTSAQSRCAPRLPKRPAQFRPENGRELLTFGERNRGLTAKLTAERWRVRTKSGASLSQTIADLSEAETASFFRGPEPREKLLIVHPCVDCTLDNLQSRQLICEQPKRLIS